MTEHETSRPTSDVISRRTLAAGVAWAAPVVAVAAAAPTYAMSLPDIPCEVIQTYDNLPVGQCVTNITFQPSAVTATISYSASYGTDNTPGDTCQVRSTNPAPPRQPWRYVELEMLNPQANWRIDVTITLSQAMENLRFQLHDIDSRSRGFQDTVRIVTPGYTLALGAGLQGDGTDGNRIRPNQVGDYNISSGLGDAVVTWAGPIQTVTFSYIAGITGNSQNQHIGLGNISFSDCITPDQPRARRSTQVSNEAAPRTTLDEASAKAKSDSETASVASKDSAATVENFDH